jgi:hypothetical protein
MIRTSAFKYGKYFIVLFVVAGAMVAVGMCNSAGAQQKMSPSGWVENPENSTAPNTVSDGAGKTPLQGGVQHSDELAPLPQNLQTGSIYDEKSIPKTADETGWYEIPDWLAGKWLREEETILSTYFFDRKVQQNEPRTIAEREIADFGFQRDKFGHVWHYRLASKGVSDCGSYLAIAFVQTQEPLHVADDLVVIRDVFIEVQVNKETNVILHSSQAESITRYRPVRDGLIKTLMSVKVFKEDGTPYTIQKNTAFDKRMQPFKTTEAYSGMNLHQNFVDFLRATGKDSLVP